MHSARDRRDEADALEALRDAADALDLADQAHSIAADLYLSDVPDAERSKPAAAAASLYAATLIAGDERSQSRVAAVVGVSRIAVQQRWRERLATAGMEPPNW